MTPDARTDKAGVCDACGHVCLDGVLRPQRDKALRDLDRKDHEVAELRAALGEARRERNEALNKVLSLQSAVTHQREWLDERAMYLAAAEDACNRAEQEAARLRAALEFAVERDHAEALEMVGPTRRAMRPRGPECGCASCRELWPEVPRG